MGSEKKKQSQPLKLFLILAILIPLVLTIIATTIGRKELSLPHRLALEVIGVASSAVTHTTNFFGGIWDSYFDLVGVHKENKNLLDEVQRYKSLNAKYREAAATNVRLSRLLELEQSFDTPVLTAQIVGRDPSLWFKTLTINRGSSSGVERGMPVITLEGVVGQVSNVSPHYAKILLATDPNSAIDAIVQKSRAQGIIKGDGKSYQLHYVLKKIEVNKGDEIVTSGMGGMFPKGLAIGTVDEVLDSKRGMFHRVKLTPSVDFRQLEHVTILFKTDPLAE
nr:rod shape-determining protein MreC [Desulfobulbaceae bacterium]